MKLIFHGGANEVGRSCIELRTNGDRFLLDCGVKFHDGGMDYPEKVFESRALDGVFLSHAHLDHSGGLPFFTHYHMTCPIFCTKETREMVKVLLMDSWRLAHTKHLCEPYMKPDMLKALDDCSFVPFNKERRIRSVAYTYLNAGHIPGSASVRIRAEGKTLLYTGDYNTEQTALMTPADPATWGPVDILITEATYGLEDHKDRAAVRDAFLAKIREVLGRGGRVLIPVFAVGRAQEILMLLADVQAPIYVDGMAKTITKIVVRGSTPYVRDIAKLRRAYRKAEIVDNPHERAEIMNKPGIFIATSGMLEGGPARSYMDHFYTDPKNAVLLSGYQVQHTRGWWLDQDRTWKVDGQVMKVACEVARFDFSAHLARSDIQAVLRATKPRVIILNHGSPDAIAALREWAARELGSTVYCPKVGDEITVENGSSSLQAYAVDDGYAFPEAHQHGGSCVTAVEHDE